METYFSSYKLQLCYADIVCKIVNNIERELSENVANYKKASVCVEDSIKDAIGKESLFTEQIKESVLNYFRQYSNKYELHLSLGKIHVTYFGLSDVDLIKQVHANILIDELDKVGISARRYNIDNNEDARLNSLIDEIRLKRSNYKIDIDGGYKLCDVLNSNYISNDARVMAIKSIAENFKLNLNRVLVKYKEYTDDFEVIILCEER